jgi:phosphoglycolate phosphatase
MPPLLICDLDGTLLDTLDDLTDSMNDALRSFGFATHDVEAYRLKIGDGAQLLAARAVPAAHAGDPATVEAVYQAYLAAYERRWRFKTRPYDGIADLLDACAGQGTRLAVYSNKPDRFTRLTVEALLPSWPWAVIRGQRPDTARKPAPDGALAVAAELGLPPEACAFLGDSEADMLCARAAGMTAIGALWGFRSEEEITAAGAHHLATTPGDVWPVLRSFGQGEA